MIPGEIGFNFVPQIQWILDAKFQDNPFMQKLLTRKFADFALWNYVSHLYDFSDRKFIEEETYLTKIPF